jgi:hypothetical protein
MIARLGGMRNQTWFACVVCVFAVIPAFIVAGVIALIMQVLNGMYGGNDYDILYLRALFGIEWPSLLIKFIFFKLIPVGVQGGFAGAIAVWLTAKATVGVELHSPALVTGSLYTGMVVLLGIILVTTRPSGDAVLSIIEETVRLIGLWIGLLSTAEEMNNVHPARPAQNAS